MPSSECRVPSVRSWVWLAFFTASAMVALLGCDVEPHKTDAELGLNPQQAHGRRVFEQRCQECHFAYISRNLHGPSLQGLYKKPAMSSGIPTNDERVRELIVLGRSKMPAFGRVLTPEQVDDLLAYLHTL